MFRVVFVALLLSWCSVAMAEEWDLATAYPEQNFHTENVRWFSEEVAGASAGALNIRVHPGGGLLRHPQIWDAVASGEVAAGELLLSSRSGQDSLLAVDSVPFLAGSYQQSDNLYRVAEPVFRRHLRSKGMIPLFSVPWPPQGLYLSAAITSIDALHGLRLRTYNRTTSQMAGLIGARPVNIEYRELGQAFADGRVDAMFTSATSGVEIEAWRFVSHFYDLQAWLPRNIVVVSAQAFNRLPPGVRKIVLETARRAERRGLEQSQSTNEKHKQLLVAKGVRVLAPGPKLQQEFRMLGNVLVSRWIRNAGQEGAELIADYVRQ